MRHAVRKVVCADDGRGRQSPPPKGQLLEQPSPDRGSAMLFTRKLRGPQRDPGFVRHSCYVHHIGTEPLLKYFCLFKNKGGVSTFANLPNVCSSRRPLSPRVCLWHPGHIAVPCGCRWDLRGGHRCARDPVEAALTMGPLGVPGWHSEDYCSCGPLLPSDAWTRLWNRPSPLPSEEQDEMHLLILVHFPAAWALSEPDTDLGRVGDATACAAGR